MATRDESKHITFTCEFNGCSNEKTILLSTYKRQNSHYCSPKCHGLSKRGKKSNNKRNPKNSITYVCDDANCTNIKTVWNSTYNNARNHFCSKDCAYKNRVGRYGKNLRISKFEKELILKNTKQKIDNYFKGL